MLKLLLAAAMWATPMAAPDPRLPDVPDTLPLLVLSNPCDASVWPEVKDKNSYAFYVCHEKGHALGWEHSPEALKRGPSLDDPVPEDKKGQVAAALIILDQKNIHLLCGAPSDPRYVRYGCKLP